MSDWNQHLREIADVMFERKAEEKQGTTGEGVFHLFYCDLQHQGQECNENRKQEVECEHRELLRLTSDRSSDFLLVCKNKNCTYGVITKKEHLRKLSSRVVQSIKFLYSKDSWAGVR